MGFSNDGHSLIHFMTIEAVLAAMERQGVQEGDLDAFFGSIVSNNRIAQLRQKRAAVEQELEKSTEPSRNTLIEIDNMIKDEELKLRAIAGK